MSAAAKHKIYFLLQRVSHGLKKQADQIALNAGGLTAAQAGVLSIIIKQGTTNQAHIARTLSQRESATMTMATRLEAAGYISKKRSRTDRRAFELSATEKGEAAFAEMSQSLQQMNKILEASVSQEGLEQLAGCLTSILAKLEETDDET